MANTLEIDTASLWIPPAAISDLLPGDAIKAPRTFESGEARSLTVPHAAKESSKGTIQPSKRRLLRCC
jgi:hypothetical protein